MKAAQVQQATVTPAASPQIVSPISSPGTQKPAEGGQAQPTAQDLKDILERMERMNKETAASNKATNAAMLGLAESVAKMIQTQANPDLSLFTANVKTPPASPPATTTSTGVTVKHLHPLDDYIPCLFSKEDVAFFRGGQMTYMLRASLLQELKIQAGIGRVMNKAKLYELLKDEDPSQYNDLIDRAVADDHNLIVQSTADKDQAAAITAVKAALQSSMGGTESFKVGCSQSILTYKEAHDIYGQRVAATYIPIQVIVRNLDPDHEFMMHDVQVAVDRMRFVGGRDRVLVRGVATVGQSEDPRNRWIRIAEALGDLASAVTVPLTSRDFKNGVAVFRSGLIPGLKSIFPDYTIDQLNRLNDTAFSASTSYKIVVPKNGSVPFVTFLPSDIYGVTEKDPATGKTLDSKEPALFPVKYKGWDRSQLQWLQENTYVVFAGVHITELDKNKSTLSKLDCATNADGTLDLSKAKDGSLTCKISGDNLSALSSIRLKSSVESSDTVVADGTVTVESDDKNGTVVFKVDDLSKLKGTKYGVYTVSKTGQENSTSIKEVQLAVAVTAISPTSIKTKDCKTCGTFTLTGQHLDAIGGASLVADDGNTIPGLFDGPAKDGKRSGSFSAGNLKAIKAKADYTLVITVDHKDVKTDKKVSLDPGT